MLFSGQHHLSGADFNPASIFNNDAAVKVFGAGAAGVALFGAFWSWVGFEMAPNYAEESREPKKLMGPATYISVIGLGILYMFVAWMFVSGEGGNGAAKLVSAQYAGTIESAFYPETTQYVGSALTDVFKVLIITSSFACATAFYNTSARYTFSMSRERLMPSYFAHTHQEHGAPHRASMLVTILVLAWVVAFTIGNSSDSAALLQLGTWVPLFGVLGILFVQALCSVAIIRYFLTEARDGFHWWRTLVAPLIGTAAMIGACYLLIANRADLSGAGSAWFIKYIPWEVLVVFLIGIGFGLYYRSTDRARYDNIGRHVFDGAVEGRAPAAGSRLTPRRGERDDRYDARPRRPTRGRGSPTPIRSSRSPPTRSAPRWRSCASSRRCRTRSASRPSSCASRTSPRCSHGTRRCRGDRPRPRSPARRSRS